MRDISLNGIGFESDVAIESRLPFSIIIPSIPLDGRDSAAKQAFVARLKWCQKTPQPYKYVIGAELLFKGYPRNLDVRWDSIFRCDLCGARLYTQLYQTNEHLQLCLNCFKKRGGVSAMQMIKGNMISNILKSLLKPY